MSAYREALAAGQYPDLIMCPHCGEVDAVKGASMIKRQEDGSYGCDLCGTDFRPPTTKETVKC